jgi:hypothetical protein
MKSEDEEELWGLNTCLLIMELTGALSPRRPTETKQLEVIYCLIFHPGRTSHHNKRLIDIELELNPSP